MKKIILIPPVINPYRDGNDPFFMPLGLLAIAASLKADNHGFLIYLPKKRLVDSSDYQWVANDILATDPRLVGFSTWCITYPSSLLVAEQVKLQSPSTPIVFGGPQASLLPLETLQNFPFVDYVLAGETDMTFPAFLNELIKIKPEWHQIPGLTYRSETGQLHTNPLTTITSNLDELPLPAYELYTGKSSLKLDVGRGCPYKCTFCTTSGFFSKKYRIKSPDRILHEMHQTSTSLKINRFSFAHDLFTLNKMRVNELCTKLISLKTNKATKYTWTCSARIDCVDKNLLQRMKDAGCESIFFGIESGSERIQKSIQKNLDIPQIYRIADICRQTGMNMHASFIVGFPDETENDLEKTMQCALKLILKGALVQISELSLLPGTPLYLQHREKLRFDGLFSNFSNTYCSFYELKHIKKYPELFSSFYYLPVKTLNHKEIHFLCRFVNFLFHFRNTFFLLRELIEQDLSEKKLFMLIKAEYARWENNGLPEKHIVSHLVNLLRNYLLKNKDRIQKQELNDVFAFEAFQALLLIQFEFQQFISEKKTGTSIISNPFIKLNSAWRILKVSQKLDKILPEKYGWANRTVRNRKNNYTYLLAAISNIKCIHFRITETDVILLNLLSETTVDDFLRLASGTVSESDALIWLRKMKNRGILEILQSR